MTASKTRADQILSSVRRTGNPVELSTVTNARETTRHIRSSLDQFPDLAVVRGRLIRRDRRLRDAVGCVMQARRRVVDTWASVVRLAVVQHLKEQFVIEYGLTLRRVNPRSGVEASALCKAEAAIYEQFPTIAAF
jgi:hypothetical protein